jgi:pyruvate dehydrogenase E2 component (dihydrolipoamide acetyltransferase)
MAEATLHIPQIGEGLQEARLVATLKKPGDHVRRDEPIYQMETDKAVMDVESPYEGTLVSWSANVDDVLPIGAPVAVMETSDAVESAHAEAPEAVAPAAAASPSAPAADAGDRRRDIPPRTRAYAKKVGVSEDDLNSIPAVGSKLMPEDVDAWLASAGQPKPYSETALTGKQRILASRLQRGSQLVVPGSMTVAMDWEPIEALRAEYKASGGDFQPSAFTLFAYAAAKAAGEHPSFRSTLVGDDKARTYHHVQLGIAVALPGDELVLAVVRDADTLSWPEFAQQMRDRIDEARAGKDQADESVTLSLTNMQAFGIRDAVAVVVPPSIATVFLGEPYYAQDPSSAEPATVRRANLGMTFDHRLINGVGAAHFQNRMRELAEKIRETIGE